MNAAEIILLILGFASISVSFFVGNRREDNDGTGGAAEENASKDIWTEKEEELVREQIAGIMKEEKEQVIAETTESLNRKSNEKIMEFDEFSSQILEKINRNHEEVVFMYNMLNEKEKELKEAAAKKTVKKQERAAKPKAETSGPAAPASGAVKKPGAPKAVKPEPAVKKQAPVSKENANDAIIQMYKQGKTVLEISKELNIGQGEVKLMIALYGGNR